MRLLSSALRRGLLAAVMLATGSSALAQSATDLTSYYLWDKDRRLIMKIGQDPDGPTLRPNNQPSALRRAEKFTYDDDGLLMQTEVGTVASVSIDAAGVVTASGFQASAKTQFKYDAIGNRTQVYTNGGASAATLTETSYDAVDRPVCTAVRMTPTSFAALYAAAGVPDACAPPPAGATNPDRVSKTVYDAAGQVKETIQALGTDAARTYARYSYTDDGKQQTITDANANKTTLVYDGFDRLEFQYFPSPVRCAVSQSPCVGASSTTDYEQYVYDANGNRKRLRKRDGAWIDYEFDALNRMTRKSGAQVATVDYKYDLTGNARSTTFNSNGDGVSYGYDTAGRMTSETLTGRLGSGAQYSRALTYDYDKAGNRTSLAWPDGVYLSNTVDAAGKLTAVALTTNPAFITYGFDDLGRRTSARALGETRKTDWTFDAGDRLKTLTHTLPGQAVAYGFDYNAANQVTSATVSNDAFVWTGTSSSLNAVADGLNRDAGIVSISGGGCAASGKGYDCNGNITSDGHNRTFAYDGENRLTAVNGATLQYDPLGRLIQVTADGATTQFLYAGDKLVAEYDGAGGLLRRYAPSYGVDEAIIWWEGSDFSSPRTLHADRQGSVIASVADSTTTIYTYGPYGEPGDRWGAGSRFRYTGQIALPELRLYHYKARAYDPERGWFLQTDPIGYKDDQNLYAYVAGDPLNKTDPTGEEGANAGWSPESNYDAGARMGTLLRAWWDNASNADRGEAIGYGVGLVAGIFDGPPGDEGITAAAGGKVGRQAGQAVDDVGLSGRGYRPADGERTMQGQADRATAGGTRNPTVSRNGRELFRLRSNGHGKEHATATPQNQRNVNPRTGQVFRGKGPDRNFGKRDMKELYKAQDGQDGMGIRTRSGAP